jgi:hypothetical protein
MNQQSDSADLLGGYDLNISLIFSQSFYADVLLLLCGLVAKFTAEPAASVTVRIDDSVLF